jgi:phage repressor protein C with HTH and peptisase S24 domain
MAHVNDASNGSDDTISVPDRASGAEKTAFVERLRTILTQWPSADRLAREMKVSPSAFRKWLKGEAEPSRERLVALARAAGVGIAWLADGEGEAPVFGPASGKLRRPGSGDTDMQVDWGRFVLVPRQPGSPANGTHHQIAAPFGAFLALRQDWVRAATGAEPENLVLTVASDDAMAPTITTGDTLLIDVTRTVVDEPGLYLLDIGGQRVVKRVQRRHDGSLVLISDNQAYLPDTVPARDAANISVAGRVVWIGSAV